MRESDDENLVLKLCSMLTEKPWLEFKHNNSDPHMIGKYVSALANSALLAGKSRGFIIFGICNKTHEVLGTTVRLAEKKKGNENFELWLNRMVRPELKIEFRGCVIDGKRVEILELEAAYDRPVKFENIEYIRINDVLQRLDSYPEKARRLWELTTTKRFEDRTALSSVSFDEICEKMDLELFSQMIYGPEISIQRTLSNLISEGFIVDKLNGKYDVKNILALVSAKNLNDFPTLSNKAARVVVYSGQNKKKAESDQTGRFGYFRTFGKTLDYIKDRLPKREVMLHGLKKIEHVYPEDCVRELLSNTFIHQELVTSNSGPMVEIYSDKIVFINHGRPLIEPESFLFSPPKSRNDKLSELMRRANLCEKRGSGVGVAIRDIETSKIAPPLFRQIENSTVVTVYGGNRFNHMTKEDKIRACFQHATIKYIDEDPMKNSTLRERLGLNKNQYQVVSTIITETIEAGKIRPLDEEQGNRNARYVPYWT